MRLVLAIIVGLAACSCESTKNSLSLTAASLPIEGKALDRIDLVNMIDPENRRSQIPNTYCRRNADREPDDFDGTDMQCAVSAFETYFMTNIEFQRYIHTFGPSAKLGVDKENKNSKTESGGRELTASDLPSGLLDDFQIRKAKSYALALKRNEIQDAIMRHSDEYCRIFQEDVSDNRALFQAVTGGLTTTLGGLGSIFTNAGVARALAGAAGITSGLNSEFESAFFQQQALTTIYAGIALRRQRIGRAIHNRRFRIIDPAKREQELENQKPITSVVASYMRDGKIHDSSAEIPWSEVNKFAAAGNYLFVVNTGDNDPSPAPKDPPPPDKPAGDKPEDAQDRNTTSLPETPPKPVALVSIASYTLERSIGDALIYHQACTLTEGLLEAENSIDGFTAAERVGGITTSKNIIEAVQAQRLELQGAATGAPAK